MRLWNENESAPDADIRTSVDRSFEPLAVRELPAKCCIQSRISKEFR